MTNNLAINWGISKCGAHNLNHHLRLKIGSFHNNDLVFESNNFFIPDSYKDQQGKMFFRITDPAVENKTL